MFSLEQLLFAIANDQRTDIETLDQVVPMMLNVFEIEKQNRQNLKVSWNLKMLLNIFFNNISILGFGCYRFGKNN